MRGQIAGVGGGLLVEIDVAWEASGGLVGGQAQEDEAPDAQVYEVEGDGGNDLVPWVVGLGTPVLLIAIVAALVAALRAGHR